MTSATNQSDDETPWQPEGFTCGGTIRITTYATIQDELAGRADDLEARIEFDDAGNPASWADRMAQLIVEDARAVLRRKNHSSMDLATAMERVLHMAAFPVPE